MKPVKILASMKTSIMIAGLTMMPLALADTTPSVSGSAAIQLHSALMTAGAGDSGMGSQYSSADLVDCKTLNVDGKLNYTCLITNPDEGSLMKSSIQVNGSNAQKLYKALVAVTGEALSLTSIGVQESKLSNVKCEKGGDGKESPVVATCRFDDNFAQFPSFDQISDKCALASQRMDCYSSIQDVINSELDAVYNRLITSYQDNARLISSLRAAERSWVSFRDNECSWETQDARLNLGNDSAVALENIQNQCLYQLIVSRIQTLKASL